MEVKPIWKEHVQGILDLLNHEIVNSTALFDYEPRTLKMMESWFELKSAGNFPVVGIEGSNGKLIGFGSYGNFRSFPAYKYTVELSVYVDKDHRGNGHGIKIVKRLIELADQQGKHCLVAGIESSNVASINLHTNLGFIECGQIKECGFKFGRWLDLTFMQLKLKGPVKPLDGNA